MKARTGPVDVLAWQVAGKKNAVYKLFLGSFPKMLFENDGSSHFFQPKKTEVYLVQMIFRIQLGDF